MISVLAVAVGAVAVTVSIAVIQRDSGAAPRVVAVHPSPVSHDGEIRGTLLISPPFTAEYASSGSIVITGAKGFTITVGESGRFTVVVPPGTYTVIGHSPKFFVNGREGDCITQSGPTTVRTNRTVTLSVRCLEK